jgi:glycosyltransferase involved in cell wall biosynthesis
VPILPNREVNLNQVLPKICIFLPSLGGGGVEKMRVIIANELSRRGFAVDLVLGKAVGPNLKDVENAVRVVNLNSSRAILSIIPLMKYIRRERPGVVLSAMNYANVAAATACSLSRTSVKLISSEHANFGSEVEGPVTLKQKIVFKLLRFAYKRVHSLIAVSAGVADDVSAYTGYPIEKIKIIYNPIYNENLVKRSEKPLAHPWFAEKKNSVIVAAGRLTHIKGFDVLIDAFALASEKRGDLRLVILGEGELRGSLQEQILSKSLEDKVSLLGFVENPYPFMKKASLFVLSSRMESFGNVLVEAMACGVQVISTACRSGPMEILENGRWGKMVPVENSPALAEAILSSLEMKKRPAVRSRAEYFSVDRAVDAYASEILATKQFC